MCLTGALGAVLSEITQGHGYKSPFSGWEPRLTVHLLGTRPPVSACVCVVAEIGNPSFGRSGKYPRSAELGCLGGNSGLQAYPPFGGTTCHEFGPGSSLESRVSGARNKRSKEVSLENVRKYEKWSDPHAKHAKGGPVSGTGSPRSRNVPRRHGRTDCFRGANRVAGVALWQPGAAFCSRARSSADWVAGTALSQGGVQIAWQAQHFRKVR